MNLHRLPCRVDSDLRSVPLCHGALSITALAFIDHRCGAQAEQACGIYLHGHGRDFVSDELVRGDGLAMLGTVAGIANCLIPGSACQAIAKCGDVNTRAQRLGLGLTEIEEALATLPAGRTPTVTDWQRVGRSLRGQLDERIKLLTRTRAKLDECIGCGCLSLPRCQLYNKDDRAAAGGVGPRFVLD